jgi:hypothetical protein
MHDISPKLFKKLNIFDGAKNRSRLRVRLRDMGGKYWVILEFYLL